MADAASWTTRLAVAGTLLGLASTAIGIRANVHADAREDKKVDLSQTVADRDYLLKVTDKVFDAIAKGEERQQRVAASLVDTLAPGGVRDRLQSALIVAAVPEVSSRVSASVTAERSFNAQQAADAEVAKAPAATGAPVAAPVSNSTRVVAAGSGAYAVDVFYCEGGDHQQVAGAIATGLQGQPDVGRVRIRLLPSSKNAQPGYGVATNQVRYDGPELALARKLSQAASAASGQPFDLSLSYSSTRNYLSVFACALTPGAPA